MLLRQNNRRISKELIIPVPNVRGEQKGTAMNSVPTFELIEMLNYIKARRMVHDVSYLYSEYKNELEHRIPSISLLY